MPRKPINAGVGVEGEPGLAAGFPAAAPRERVAVVEAPVAAQERWVVDRERAREAVALLREQAARVEARVQRESRQHLPGRMSRRGRRRAFSNRGSARGLDAA